MATNVRSAEIGRLLSVLQKEGEMIIKPFHSGTAASQIGAVERGKIVSRMNRVLFDYQIGDQANNSVLTSIFNQRIRLFDPETKQEVLELYYNRFPFLCKVSCKQDVRCLTSSPSESQPIGSIQQRLSFSKLWYDVYNSNYEHAITLMLRKSHLISKIQHRVPEFTILDRDEITHIGRIYLFSSDLERSQYGHAVAIKLPQDMNVEVKATLLIATLILKSRLN